MSKLHYLAASLLTPAAVAQTTLVLEGDSVPGVGSVTSISNISIDSSGRWWVEVDTDNTDTTMDGVVLRDGSVYLVEGDAVSAPAGASVRSFDAARSTDAGQVLNNMLLNGTIGGNLDDDAIYLDDILVLQGDDLVGASGVGAGTTFGSVSDVQVTNNLRMLMRGFYDDPNVSGTTDYYCLSLELDAAGNILSETRIAGEGDIPPGQTLVINTIRTGPHAAAINSNGDVIWCADLDTASPPSDAVVYLNNAVLAQEGLATGFGALWGDLVSPEVDINTAGDWTIKDQADGDYIIVKNGASFRREGDSLPAISPFLFEYFGNGPADLTESGQVLWFGRWSDPDSSIDEGLFLDDTLLVQQGVTQINGMTVVDVGDQSENYMISPNGKWIIFEATVDDAGVDRDGAFVIALGGPGTNYCVASVNSTGSGASISASGSNSVAANDLVLSAQPLPAGQPGLFFYGPNQTMLAFGNGFRCITGGTIARLAVHSASGAGVLTHALDYTQPPTAGTQINAGSTWNFQSWYRDPAAGGAFFNLSDGLEISFQP